VLVTGGTGSIGRYLVREIRKHKPHAIRVFSRDEYKQFAFGNELDGTHNVRFLLGDIRDKSRLSLAMEDVDYVFNAAALKQIPSCEYNPFEAVKTNVIGTQNIIECAMEHNVEKVVLISTDKVVNPYNTMGTTKLLAEKLMATANRYKGSKRTVFSCVRFGNVLGSRGSVIPLLLEQLRSGKELTLTHKDMTRFIMTLERAVFLVLQAARRSRNGEIFILKMPVVRIADVFAVLNGEYARRKGYKPCPIKETGIRPGEKLHEELMSEHEVPFCREEEDMFVIDMDKKNMEIDKSKYHSAFAVPLDSQAILEMLLLIDEKNLFF
jgi:FlaA1/EpsC-like NDP-sugar epimerase